MIIIQLVLIIFGAAIIVIVKNLFERNCPPTMEPIEPFRVSDYYGRRIKAAEDIARDRASEKPEPMVLWLVLDGLQINKDGSLKWIQKDPPKTPDYICSHRSSGLMMLPTYANFYADNICVETRRLNDCVNATEDMRTRLVYAMAQTSMSTAQAMQAIELMNWGVSNVYHS